MKNINVGHGITHDQVVETIFADFFVVQLAFEQDVEGPVRGGLDKFFDSAERAIQARLNGYKHYWADELVWQRLRRLLDAILVIDGPDRQMAEAEVASMEIVAARLTSIVDALRDLAAASR